MKALEEDVSLGHMQLQLIEIEGRDTMLKRMFLQVRTDIWTRKYAEEVSGEYEVDQYDDRSVYLGIIDNEGDIVGGCRIIHAANGECLPIDEIVKTSGNAIEISRFFLLHKVGVTDNPQVFAWFVRALSRYVARMGYAFAYATVRTSLFAKLRFVGIPMERIGQDQKHKGTKFVPAMLWSLDHPDAAVRRAA